MNKYKLIIFDFDGTLCATHEAILFCLRKAYEALGKSVPLHPMTDAAIRMGISMEGVLKILSPELSGTETQQLLAIYEHVYLQEGEQKSVTFTNAHHVLATLHAAGFILTVVSNKALAAVQAALKHFALQQYIEIVVGETKHWRKKPDPMAYIDFIKPAFNTVLPSEILMVGDTATDLLFAQNIGAASCWAAYGYGDSSACRALQPNYTIIHLTELVDILL